MYVGEYFFSKKNNRTGEIKDRREWVRIPVAPLIDRELFEEARSLRESRQPTPKHPPSVTASRTLLTGILYCGKCGSRMVIETAKSNQYRYYSCSSYIRRGRSSCRGNRLPEADLDTQILKHLSKKFFTRKRIREIIVHVNRELTERRNRNSTKLKTLHNELEGVRTRIRKHYEAI